MGVFNLNPAVQKQWIQNLQADSKRRMKNPKIWQELNKLARKLICRTNERPRKNPGRNPRDKIDSRSYYKTG